MLEDEESVKILEVLAEKIIALEASLALKREIECAMVSTMYHFGEEAWNVYMEKVEAREWMTPEQKDKALVCVPIAVKLKLKKHNP